MTNGPSEASSKEHAPAPRPRPRRGEILSFGQGRTCATPGCQTTLSRYNRDERCWRHELEALEALKLRARS